MGSGVRWPLTPTPETRYTGFTTMTAFHHYDLMCDHPGCTARYRGGPRATQARDEAAQAGWRSWTRRRFAGPAMSCDSCPVHASEIPDDAEVTPVAIMRSL